MKKLFCILSKHYIPTTDIEMYARYKVLLIITISKAPDQEFSYKFLIYSLTMRYSHSPCEEFRRIR